MRSVVLGLRDQGPKEARRQDKEQGMKKEKRMNAGKVGEGWGWGAGREQYRQNQSERNGEMLIFQFLINQSLEAWVLASLGDEERGRGGRRAGDLGPE